MQTHPGVSVAAPRMLNGDGSIQPTARNFPNALNGVFGRQSVLTRWFPNNPISRRYLRSDGLLQSEPYEVEWVSAACMIFPAALVHRNRSLGRGFSLLLG